MGNHKVAIIYKKNVRAGKLEEIEKGKFYVFTYEEGYEGDPVSLTMPLVNRRFEYDEFPPFFEGLLPEGFQLEALLKKCKLDSDDLFEQLLVVGGDVVGDVTIKKE